MTPGPTRPKALISRTALLSLLCLALLVLYGLMPLAEQRQAFASSSLPSALSLRFLELGVRRAPDDHALRLRLAHKQYEAGLSEQARTTVLQLRERTPLDAATEQFLLSIEHARWAAVDARDTVRRSALRSDLCATLATLHIDTWSVAEQLTCADVYRELEDPRSAAELLDRLARRATDDSPQLAAAADAAWLAADQPLSAAELASALAARDVKFARLALARARMVDRPEVTAELLTRMLALYPDDGELNDAALSAAAATSDEGAFALANRLTQSHPDEPKYHRELAKFAEATGRALCALDQYVWLWRREHRAADHTRALALARSQWDLELVRELTDGRPARTPRRRAAGGCQGHVQSGRRRAEIQERVRLYETLGDVAAARRELAAGAASRPDDEVLWREKVDLELRVQDHAAALQTLLQQLARAPDRALRERAVELLLASGRTAAALELLQAIPSAQLDPTLTRRIAELAAVAGDIGAERNAYDRLVRESWANTWDYQRWLQLAPDPSSARRAADLALDRTQSLVMFYAAFELRDERERMALLRHGAALPNIARRHEYWQTRVTFHQARAARAARSHHYSDARLDMELASEALETAELTAPAPALYSALWRAQRAQALALALEMNDLGLLSRTFAEVRAQLNPRERVFILTRLSRAAEARHEARAALLTTELVAADRHVLENDLTSLSHGRADVVQVQGSVANIESLTMWQSSARFEYTRAAGGFSAQAALAQLAGSRASGLPSVRDFAAQLLGNIAPLTLVLGASVRDERALRPFGSLALQFFGDAERGASLEVQGNVLTTDTAWLRTLAVRDTLSTKLALGLGEYVWLSARASGEAFYTRFEREYLGWGMTVDGAVGASTELPSSIGQIGVRLAARLAPRIARPIRALPRPLDQRTWLPASSEWLGLGASIGRGRSDAPPLIGRVFTYSLDLAAGWLWPASGLGYTAQARLGFSLLGADLFCITASAGNIVGSAAWSAGAAYSLSFDS